MIDDCNSVLEEYTCEYAACPFCNKGVCIGNKQIAIKYNFCYKEKYKDNEVL